MNRLLSSREGNFGSVESMSNFKSVIERLRTLENERKNLLLEIEELRKMADSRAEALQSEVSMLKEEVKSLRVLLGADEPEPDPVQKKKQLRK
jgi:regulator of replication initiation timing